MVEIINAGFQNSFIFILLCLFTLLCYYLLLKPKHSNFPPSPPSLPIIGHLHLLFSALTHKSLQKLSSKYGPLLHLRVFNFPVVLVSSGSIAYDIFKAQDVNISSHGTQPKDDSIFVGSYGFISAPYGDYWKFMKKLIVTKLVGSQALERSRGIRADELQNFYTTLLDKAVKSESVEIIKEATKLSNNIICKMSMGRSCSEEKGEVEKIRGLVTDSVALTKKLLLANLLRKPLRISLFKKEIMSVSNRFDELLERILQEHEEKLDSLQGTDMMDMLLAAYRDENAECKITRKHIKSLLVELFLAGTDTSAQTIQWAMAELINNPKILEKSREEIESVVGRTRLIQETDLPNLPYLHAVIKEVLRLHPPTPLLVRMFQEGCTVGGFCVPAKTTLVVNTYVVMRDPNFWEDPEEFKPERFLVSSRGQEEEKEKAMKYIPFGSGRRGCPGVNLGYMIVETAVGMMVQCFDWRINGDKVKMEEAGDFSITMAHPLKCTPIARPHMSLSTAT